MYNRKYYKKFITLKSDSERNKSGERNPTGSCVIETSDNSCKIITYVQGIKKSNDSEHFFVYLVCANQNESVGVPIGEINIAQTGKGMLKNDINANNVGGSKIPIEKFNAVAVFESKGADKKGNLLTLEGFFDEHVSWKNNFKEIDEAEKTSKNEKVNTIKKPLEAKKEQILNDVKKEPVIKNIRSIKEPKAKEEKEMELNVANSKEKDNPHEAFKKISENFRKELEDLEQLGIIGSKSNQKEEFAKEKDIDKSNRMTDMDYMFANNQKLALNANNDDIDWVRIGLNDLVLLPISSCLMVRNPFIVSCFRMYNHLILGRQKNKNGYYLGIPDKYKESYTKSANDLGFNRFVPCQMVASSKESENYGYWIMEF